jgi:hypothetical protein
LASDSTISTASEGRGGRHHGDDVGIVLEIVRQHGHDDLGVVAVAIGKERTDRTVDEAGDQGLLLGRAAFALEVAAGDAAGRVGALLVVHREGQEVDARLRLLGRDDGGEHGGLAVGGDDGAVGLTGHLAGFEHELAPGPDQLFALDVEHGLVFHDMAAARCHEQDGKGLGGFDPASQAPCDPAMAIASSASFRRTRGARGVAGLRRREAVRGRAPDGRLVEA